MLLSRQELLNQTILSLQLGGPLGSIKQVIVDPKNLTIVALELENGFFHKERSFILTDSIREHHKIGIVVDSADEIVGYSDVIKLEKILDRDFNLLNLKVYTKSGKSIGEVVDFTTIYGLFMIYQIYVKRNGWKNLLDNELIIDRNMIIDVTDTKIIIEDEFEKIKESNRFEAQKMLNPFRKEPQRKSAISKE